MANVNKKCRGQCDSNKLISLSLFAVGTQGDSSHQEVHDQSALEQKTNGEWRTYFRLMLLIY